MTTPRYSKVQIVLLAVVCAAAAGAVMVPSGAPAAIALDAQEAEFCRAINQYRATNGLGPLLVSEKLSVASEWYSTDMATKDYVSRDHTDSLGRTIKQRIVAFGYDYNTYYAENIAWGYAGAAAVFEVWRNSAVHNTNMLNPNFKVIGIGRATNAASNFGTYWTTDFGGFVDSTATPCPGSTPTPAPSPSATATSAGPAISVADAATLEGNSTTGDTKVLRLTVSIPRATNRAVRVAYATSDGTARAGSDYQATSGVATIRSGYTTAVIRVRVIKDRVVEPDESFKVTLSNPENGSIADGSAVGTIRNDD
ncbi:MAG TPA: CAP domain-containing protein [Actinomycetota bacterium]|nr:CAP domain-containing protein [Actinomycetota bacterium]